MAVHQAQVAKIEGRAVPYAYGLPIHVRGPIRVWASHMRMGLVICPIRVYEMPSEICKAEEQMQN